MGPLGKGDRIVAENVAVAERRGDKPAIRCASTLFVRVPDGQQGPPQPALTTPRRQQNYGY